MGKIASDNVAVRLAVLVVFFALGTASSSAQSGGCTSGYCDTRVRCRGVEGVRQIRLVDGRVRAGEPAYHSVSSGESVHFWLRDGTEGLFECRAGGLRSPRRAVRAGPGRSPITLRISAPPAPPAPPPPPPAPPPPLATFERTYSYTSLAEGETYPVRIPNLAAGTVRVEVDVIVDSITPPTSESTVPVNDGWELGLPDGSWSGGWGSRSYGDSGRINGSILEFAGGTLLLRMRCTQCAGQGVDHGRCSGRFAIRVTVDS